MRENKLLSTALYRLTAVLLLTVLLITGCTPRNAADSTLSSAQDYEVYHASYSEDRKAFDQFTEDLFLEEIVKSTLSLHYTLADLSAFGIQNPSVSYGSATLEDYKTDMADTKAVREQLDSFSPENLSADQRLTWHILADYLDTALLSQGLELYTEPLAPTIGVQAQLPVLLAEYTFYTKEDIDTYLQLLSQIDQYYEQIGEFEKEKSAAGLFMSDATADNIIISCQSYLLSSDNNFLSQSFKERLDTVPGLSDEEKNSYITQHNSALEEHFVPAYRQLIQVLESLKGTGVNDQGMCGYPEGKEYYEYLVQATTGTSYASIADLNAAIEQQISEDSVNIGLLLKSDPDLVQDIYDYSFSPTEPSQILLSLQEQIQKDFPPLPKCNYTIKDVPKALELSLSPAFYLTPPIDRYEDNVIYINRNKQYKDEPLYPTLAHEGYPGHLYQTVYFINQDTCHLRHLLSFGSYSEGWATYVEMCSYEFDNGLKPGLQKLLKYNRSVLLGLHAYLDLRINYYGWNKDQVKDYLSQHFTVVSDDVVENIYQTMVENPANYLEYYVGYLEILNMRKAAEKAQGLKFNAKAFHQFILETGPAPFTVLKIYFQNWLQQS